MQSPPAVCRSHFRLKACGRFLGMAAAAATPSPGLQVEESRAVVEVRSFASSTSSASAIDAAGTLIRGDTLTAAVLAARAPLNAAGGPPPRPAGFLRAIRRGRGGECVYKCFLQPRFRKAPKKDVKLLSFFSPLFHFISLFLLPETRARRACLFSSFPEFTVSTTLLRKISILPSLRWARRAAR